MLLPVHFGKLYVNLVIPGAINEKLASCTTCTISLEPGSHEVVDLHDPRRPCVRCRIAPLLVFISVNFTDIHHKRIVKC